MGIVFTDAGLQLFAQKHAAKEPLVVDEIQAGTLTAATRYDATTDKASLLDNNPLILHTNFILNESGPNVLYSINFTSPGLLEADEVGIFSEGTLVLLSANAGSRLFTKAANSNALVNIGYPYSNGVPNNPTFRIQAMAIATPDQARAGNRNDVLMTPLLTKEFFEANPLDSGPEFPVGSGAIFYGKTSAIPAGWLLADGGVEQTATYPLLAAALAGLYGNPDPIGPTFIKPDLRRRVAVGVGGARASDLGNEVGSSGGSETHQLTVDEMPTHEHPRGGSDGRYNESNDGGVQTSSSAPVHEHRGVTTGQAGGSKPFPLMQPSLVVNYIIKAVQ